MDSDFKIHILDLHLFRSHLHLLSATGYTVIWETVSFLSLYLFCLYKELKIICHKCICLLLYALNQVMSAFHVSASLYWNTAVELVLCAMHHFL